FLLEQAERAGAVIRQRIAVQRVELNGQVTVRAGGESFRGRTLVAADGANGTTARLAGLRVPRLAAIALEANITPLGDDWGPWHDRFAIDVGSVPGGYGWLFPKGDHVNIGVGGWHRMGPVLRARLEALTRFYGFDPGTSWGLRGHPLPVVRPGARLVHGNVVLAGDAAGLLDPLTGEGIYSAIWSGRAAAIHLASYLGGGSPNLDGYQRDIDRELAPDLRVAAQLRDLFHLSPPAFAALVRRSPRIWQAAYGLLTGDRTYAGMKETHRLLSAAIDLGADAVRALAFRRDGHAAEDRFPPDRFFRRWAGPAGR
ncbi:MAG: NAD(P)/FAD-dependent oxidoreductase, partial [Chloroflexi bacterium]|nr:NAD(P)/FAD-dependent oxidoreductase [Chloroflexota bacterium]